MPKQNVLIVDDEPDIRELLEMTLERMNISCRSAGTLKQARDLLMQDNYFLCLADMRLPDGEGIDLVKHIQNNYSQLPVAVITAYGNIEGAVNTLKAGAFDYVSKPINLNILRGLVKTALTLADVETQTPSEVLLGHSSVMEQLRQTIHKLARSQAPVFIHGESGTGKELVAKLIHEQGPRAAQAFIAVNCGAIPNELMESEFFGHKKGSFSGAVSDKKGLFQAAQGGTLFLDEVADLPLHMQVKLLRAIQEKAVRPIGEQREIALDVRIVSASHQDLQQLVSSGGFRQDLFYRINVIDVLVPALKQRVDDIPLLAEHILQQLVQQHAIKKTNLSKASIQALCQYTFPGNVRELENILERALTLCEGNLIEPIDLQLPAEETVSKTKEMDSAPLNSSLDTQEKQTILQALERTHWNRTAAAKELGISFRSLRYRLKKFDLE